MKKTEPKKAMKSASKPLAKTVAKAAPAKKAVKPVANAKKATPAKKAVAPVKKVAPAKKVVAPVKKAAPAKKAAAPVKKAAPAKKAAAPVKKAAPAKKAAAPVKKVAPAKKAVAPVKKAVPVKKAAPAKKAEVKVAAPAKKAEVKVVAPVKKAPVPVKASVAKASQKVASARKKADKNKDVQASHHGRIVTKAEVEALRIQAEANGHVINKSHLTPKMKKHYREILLNLRASYQDQLNVHRDEALTNRKSGPGAGMATHMADLGSDNFQHDFELGLLSDEGTVIEMIDEALTRLDENEYGICMECGKEIGAARLAVKPFARFCVACKSRKEANERADRRYR